LACRVSAIAQSPGNDFRRTCLLRRAISSPVAHPITASVLLPAHWGRFVASALSARPASGQVPCLCHFFDGLRCYRVAMVATENDHSGFSLGLGKPTKVGHRFAAPIADSNLIRLAHAGSLPHCEGQRRSKTARRGTSVNHWALAATKLEQLVALHSDYDSLEVAG
jgi:hypothetical protein